MKRFATWSNLAYLAPILLVSRDGYGVALALACVGLCLGSGFYHWQESKHGTLGHLWDETAMLGLLFTLAAYVWHAAGWPAEIVLWGAALMLPFLSAMVDRLSAFWYVPVGAALSLLPAAAHDPVGVWLPAGVFALAALVRGRDDNHARHGWWHIGAALALWLLIEVMK